MSKIHDTVDGERAQGFHLPSNVEFTDMVTLFWTRFSGERFETVYPRSTANEFLAKFNPDRLATLVLDRIREVSE